MTALLLGTLLAVAALAFVLYPLFFSAATSAPSIPDPRSPIPGSSDRDLAVAALREIEFDRATGKLSEGDYAQLKTRYTERALAAMRREERAASSGTAAAVGDDDIERAISAYRARLAACPTCGPRPEPDATYCSDCGRYLPGTCAHCGATITEPAAHFCSTCGDRLAA